MNSWRLQYHTLNNEMNNQTKDKEIEDLNNTIDQLNLPDIHRTLLNKNTVHFLLKYTWDIFQDRPYIRPQIKSQLIFKDRCHTK